MGAKSKSVTVPSSGVAQTAKSDIVGSKGGYDINPVSPVNSASSMLAGAAAAALNPANRHATRRAALLGGPSAPVVKSSLQYQVVSLLSMSTYSY